MTWIKSYNSLERHPKTYKLMKLTGWDIDTTIGKLHRLWWWCQQYAEDGDLTKHTPETLAMAVGVEIKDAEKTLSALIEAGFIEKTPYLRIRHWWRYSGNFLRGKYSRESKIWQSIKEKYGNEDEISQNNENNNEIEKENEYPKEYTEDFLKFWEAWPSGSRKSGKYSAFLAWITHKPPLDKCLEAINFQKQSEAWTKENGRYIPLPATWINQHRWEDDLAPKWLDNALFEQYRILKKQVDGKEIDIVATLKELSDFSKGNPNIRLERSIMTLKRKMEIKIPEQVEQQD